MTAGEIVAGTVAALAHAEGLCEASCDQLQCGHFGVQKGWQRNDSINGSGKKQSYSRHLLHWDAVIRERKWLRYLIDQGGNVVTVLMAVERSNPIASTSHTGMPSNVKGSCCGT